MCQMCITGVILIYYYMVICVLTWVCALYSPRENICLQGIYEGQYKNNHVIMYLLYDIIIIWLGVISSNMHNSAVWNSKNYLPLLSITWQQIAKMSTVAALKCSDVSLQLIGQYRMKALMGPRGNNSWQGK